jgi:hypothetical protein
VKGALAAIGERGLDHAHAQLPRGRSFGVDRLCLVAHVELAPAEQAPERIDVIEGEGVAGHDAQVGARAQRRHHPRFNAIEPGPCHEGSHDCDLGRGLEQWPQVLVEGVVLASHRERRPAHGERLIGTQGQHGANDAAQVVHVASEARDHVDVQVLDGLARGLARVEADVVAGMELLVEG